MDTVTYIPGKTPDHPGPLARYLPPVADGVVSAWLERFFKPSSGQEFRWVLDPFGASPKPSVEAAQAGYEVIVAANNPITRFLIEMYANPPSSEALQFALAELAASRKGDERLEPHIRNLYHTSCDACHSQIEASEFIWDREAGRPIARVYTCPYCEHSGEYPVSESDVQVALRFREDRLHHARALERVIPSSDPDRRYAEEALEVYPARAVYALFTLINKLDAIDSDAGIRRCLHAFLLSACDKGNALWSYPSGRERPRQLTISPRFREHNLWKALEAAVTEWDLNHVEVPLTLWPERPGPGGISVFEGPLRDLAGQLDGNNLSAIVAALPRPNQAFWTLSALWSGWLWGQEAVGPFRAVLRRRRYDWSWHTAALRAALEYLEPFTPKGTPFLGLIGEAEPGFLSAATLAGAEMGFAIQGIALRSHTDQAQILWLKSDEHRYLNETAREALVETANQAAVKHLTRRAEPVDYLHLHCATLQAILTSRETEGASPTNPHAETLTGLNEILAEAFNYRGGLLRFGGSEKSLEVGSWWLRMDLREQADLGGEYEPLSDRVEREIVKFLIANPLTTVPELDEHVCSTFRGLLTPEIEFVGVCADSYAEVEEASESLELRSEDQPGARIADIKEMQRILTEIGAKCGFHPQGERVITWKTPSGTVKYEFHLTASGVIGVRIAGSHNPSVRRYIVLPGSRANLVLFKIKHNPALKQAVEAGWEFIKFRHIRQLAEIRLLDGENIAAHLSQDPLTESNLQMRFL
jgi:hypothetical protein